MFLPLGTKWNLPMSAETLPSRKDESGCRYFSNTHLLHLFLRMQQSEVQHSNKTVKKIFPLAINQHWLINRAKCQAAEYGWGLFVFHQVCISLASVCWELHDRRMSYNWVICVWHALSHNSKHTYCNKKNICNDFYTLLYTLLFVHDFILYNLIWLVSHRYLCAPDPFLDVFLCSIHILQAQTCNANAKRSIIRWITLFCLASILIQKVRNRSMS